MFEVLVISVALAGIFVNFSLKFSAAHAQVKRMEALFASISDSKEE